MVKRRSIEEKKNDKKAGYKLNSTYIYILNGVPSSIIDLYNIDPH